MFAAVLLDLDGVLVHSQPVWRALITALCDELGYEAPDDAAFAAMWGQGVQADVERLFVRHTVPGIAALYQQRFPDHLAALRCDPEAPGLFARLREGGLPIAVVTNTPGPLADDLLARAGVRPDTRVGGTDTPRAKPWPDPLLEACRRLGVAPERALMVGDTRVDREAAAAAGVPFCGFGGVEGRFTASTLPEVAALALSGGPPTARR